MKKIIFICFLLFYSVSLAAMPSEKKLSEQAWEQSLPVIKAIMKHPFNQAMMRGDLAKDKFAYYIEQDDIYLQDYTRCMATIASRIDKRYIHNFLKYAQEASQIEQSQVHRFFEDKFHLTKTSYTMPARLTYTNYLLRTCSLEPVEVAVAAILPCFWIYREVGKELLKNSQPNNPYHRWIQTYSAEDFSDEVNEVIAIFDDLASHTTETNRQKMLNAFYTSALLEWHFWDDAYHQRIFEILH